MGGSNEGCHGILFYEIIATSVTILGNFDNSWSQNLVTVLAILKIVTFKVKTAVAILGKLLKNLGKSLKNIWSRASYPQVFHTIKGIFYLLDNIFNKNNPVARYIWNKLFLFQVVQRYHLWKKKNRILQFRYTGSAN